MMQLLLCQGTGWKENCQIKMGFGRHALEVVGNFSLVAVDRHCNNTISYSLSKAIYVPPEHLCVIFFSSKIGT